MQLHAKCDQGMEKHWLPKAIRRGRGDVESPLPGPGQLNRSAIVRDTHRAVRKLYLC